jgi:hypothetical protein
MLFKVAAVDIKVIIQDSDHCLIQTLKLTIYIRSVIALNIGKVIAATSNRSNQQFI